MDKKLQKAKQTTLRLFGPSSLSPSCLSHMLHLSVFLSVHHLSISLHLLSLCPSIHHPSIHHVLSASTYPAIANLASSSIHLFPLYPSIIYMNLSGNQRIMAVSRPYNLVGRCAVRCPCLDPRQDSEPLVGPGVSCPHGPEMGKRKRDCRFSVEHESNSPAISRRRVSPALCFLRVGFVCLSQPPGGHELPRASLKVRP